MKPEGRRYVSIVCIAFVLCLSGLSARAQQSGSSPKSTGNKSEPRSLDELLEKVRSAGIIDDSLAKEREVEFIERKDEQATLLKEAHEREQALINRSEALERIYEANEVKATDLEETLRDRLGNMGELFGIVRQVAGDTRAHIDESIVSAQFRDRGAFLDELAQSKALPSIDKLQKLWFVLQQEMTESGKIVRFSADVVDPEGTASQKQVIRIGTFNAIADGKYLRWMPETAKLAVLNRQPQARYLDTVREFEKATEGTVGFAIDPSRGSILALLVQTPELKERIDQGGVIGYIIIGLGAVTFILALLKLFYLLFINWRIGLQRKNPANIKKSNPLGRVLQVFKDSPGVEMEALERKVDEAVLKESSRLERFLWAVKVVSIVAPLLGLLGTVTGMIRTFQAIQLFGTGDPKMMAGGISEALVTTMLGLIVAVPLVLLHSGISSIVRKLVDILEEQSMGMVAIQAVSGLAGRVKDTREQENESR